MIGFTQRALMAVAVKAGAEVPDDYIAYWSMDSISGSALDDETGSFDHTIYGAKVVSGYRHKAIEFDGVNDYTSGPAFTNNVGAVAFWFKPATTGRTRIFTQYSDSISNSYLAVRMESQKIQLVVDGADIYNANSTSLSAGVWYHIVIQSDGSSTEIYIDGVSESINESAGSDSGVWFGDISGATAFDWGRFNRNSGPSYDGKCLIDEAYHYDRTLSQTEIDALSGQKSTIGIMPQNYIAYWTMDNIAGSTLVDETGTYDGSISGATTDVGVDGDCLSFDGADDSVSFSGTVSPLGSLPALTLSAWIYWPSGAEGDLYSGIIGNVQSGGGSGGTDYEGFALTVEDEQRKIRWFGFGDNQAVSATIAADQWVHVLGFWDGSTAELFFDGVSQGSISTSNNDMTTTEELNFGKLPFADLYSPVSLDHVKLYDYRLDKDAIDLLAGEF